jgi:hypothetical protein
MKLINVKKVGDLVLSRTSCLLRSPVERVKVSCACLLSSAGHGNALLLQCMLCINRL